MFNRCLPKTFQRLKTALSMALVFELITSMSYSHCESLMNDVRPKLKKFSCRDFEFKF